MMIFLSLKGFYLIARGNIPGTGVSRFAPCKGKRYVYGSFALTGRNIIIRILRMCQNEFKLSFCHSEELATKNLFSYMSGEEILHFVLNDRMIA